MFDTSQIVAMLKEKWDRVASFRATLLEAVLPVPGRDSLGHLLLAGDCRLCADAAWVLDRDPLQFRLYLRRSFHFVTATMRACERDPGRSSPPANELALPSDSFL